MADGTGFPRDRNPKDLPEEERSPSRASSSKSRDTDIQFVRGFGDPEPVDNLILDTDDGDRDRFSYARAAAGKPQ